MEHKGTVQLSAEHILLRPFRVDDAQMMYENWAGDDRVTRFLTWPTHTSPEVSRNILAMWVKEYEDTSHYQWCITNRGNDQAIGSIGVVSMDEKIAAVEIGYCIGTAFQGEGKMTEALSRVIAFLFEEVRCNRVFAKHDTNNPGSGRVMEKAGLRYEGTLRQAGFNNQGICDLAIYGMTAEMYFTSIARNVQPYCEIKPFANED